MKLWKCICTCESSQVKTRQDKTRQDKTGLTVAIVPVLIHLSNSSSKFPINPRMYCAFCRLCFSSGDGSSSSPSSSSPSPLMTSCSVVSFFLIFSFFWFFWFVFFDLFCLLFLAPSSPSPPPARKNVNDDLEAKGPFQDSRRKPSSSRSLATVTRSRWWLPPTTLLLLAPAGTDTTSEADADRHAAPTRQRIRRSVDFDCEDGRGDDDEDAMVAGGGRRRRRRRRRWDGGRWGVAGFISFYI